MASNIGIKIANGEFYPVMEEASNVKKRLVLTTVHDGQRSVQIDLYKSALSSMADAVYIGSLVVENIAPKPKGDPSIELVISSGGNDEISAEAMDLDSADGAERHLLNVSLQALDEQGTYEVPDFELEQNEAPPSGLYEKAQAIVDEEEKRSAFPLLPVLIGVLALALVAFLLWFFLFRTPAPATPAAAPVPAEVTPPPAAPEAPKPAAAPVVTAPAATKPAEPAAVSAKRVRPPAPVKSYKVPNTIPKEGVRYKIRWGDTLWDISEAFYRNPWLYPRIAGFNKIRNPDLIISGTYLRVPPKN
jgi:nucleoid-associated protein YgaU